MVVLVEGAVVVVVVPGAAVVGVVVAGGGAVVVVAGVTVPAGGTLSPTIDGRPASGAFGQVRAGGAVSVLGTFALVRGPGFTAVPNDRYPMLLWGSGAFAHAAITGSDVSAQVSLAPLSSPNGLTLRVATAGSARADLHASSVVVSQPTSLLAGKPVTIAY